jgi:DNA mismatch repair protein MutS
MVEMTEAAVILNTATAHSFVVLDEVGRGTSTFDGLSLAWAIVEHIHDQIRAKTLFATHYHELTELARELTGVENFHVAVKEAEDRILFIRKVEPGPADRSYGIEVARLAGLPMQVIQRARSVLLHHEVREHSVTEELVPGEAEKPIQIKLFEPVNQALADRVRSLDINQIRPVEALQILQELQQELLKR